MSSKIFFFYMDACVPHGLLNATFFLFLIHSLLLTHLLIFPSLHFPPHTATRVSLHLSQNNLQPLAATAHHHLCSPSHPSRRLTFSIFFLFMILVGLLTCLLIRERLRGINYEEILDCEGLVADGNGGE